jgi:oligoribonuclease NrnB/cAMP/cGMP phosphodiesterase (DHH superfamily)
MHEKLIPLRNMIEGGGSFGLTVTQRRMLLAKLDECMLKDEPRHISDGTALNTYHVVYHRADFDGHLSGAICEHFLSDRGEVVMHGWDYGDPVPEIPEKDCLYIVDLAIPELMQHKSLWWIDHHKTSIDKYKDVFAYGILMDGVAACRLCWQWFIGEGRSKPTFEDYRDRKVNEPELVRLVGEYDVWDHRDPNAETLQFGLRAIRFHAEETTLPYALGNVDELIEKGKVAQDYTRALNETTVNGRAHRLRFHGLNFLCLNTHYGNSQTFIDHARIDEVDALMMWRFDGNTAKFSLYCAPHTQGKLDLSDIAAAYGGGGHRCACGFQLPLEQAVAILTEVAEQL